MNRAKTIILAAILAGYSSPALADLCTKWDAPEMAGSFDSSLIPEASGIAASKAYAGRFYHNNDSGDGPYFYITAQDGSGTKRITISGFEPSDVEDIALGPCPDIKSGAPACIYIADIGDNAKARKSVNLVQIAESERFGAKGSHNFSEAEIAPIRTLEARYPDGPHNAESIAIHPNGNLYLITKEVDFQAGTSAAAAIFMLTAQQLAAREGDIQTFSRVGSLDLPNLIEAGYGEEGINNQVATGMDISADGTRVLIVTYRYMAEWEQDLSRLSNFAPMPRIGHEITLTPLMKLPQSEAITYLPDTDAILYSTEAPREGGEAAIVRQICAKRGQ